MLSIACKHFTDISKKLLSTPCTQMVITAIHLHTHTHTHTHPAEPELAEATQQTQKGGDRLSALHCRLQQEAEKIRKWKNATEVEIKQKVHTVISLRKRLTKIWDCSQFACNFRSLYFVFYVSFPSSSFFPLQDKTLKDAWQTIDSQRKSLTDLQVRLRYLVS